MLILLILLAAVMIAIIIILIKSAGKRSREMECPYCHRETQQHAPCSKRICQDCCDRCNALKPDICKYIAADLSKQELD